MSHQKRKQERREQQTVDLGCTENIRIGFTHTYNIDVKLIRDQMLWGGVCIRFLVLMSSHEIHAHLSQQRLKWEKPSSAI